MCGIAAIFLYPQARSVADWQAIREIFTRNLVFNEERGRAATGLAIINQAGQAVLLKRPIPATAFVQQPEYQELLAHIGSQTMLILGHTRLPTKGSPQNSDNNHPIHTGSVIGVHNGHIANDDLLFARLGLTRRGQVDSEIIFRLLDPYPPRHYNGNYLQTIQPVLQMLEGQYTFLACHLSAPEKLLVLKHNNPLCIHYNSTWNAVIFSSRYLFLRKAFGRSLITEALPHDDLLLYDAGCLAQRRHEPIARLSISPIQEASDAE